MRFLDSLYNDEKQNQNPVRTVTGTEHRNGIIGVQHRVELCISQGKNTGSPAFQRRRSYIPDFAQRTIPRSAICNTFQIHSLRFAVQRQRKMDGL